MTYSQSGTFAAKAAVHDSDGASVQTSNTNFVVAASSTNQLLGYSIQHGQTQRSFIRFIDLDFSNTIGLSKFLKGQGIRLTCYDVSGLHPTTISLAGKIKITGTHVTIDFGAKGIGGNPMTNAGDGTYRLALDLSGNGSFSTVVQFFRLLGDVTGDGKVNAADLSLFATYQKTNNLNGDANGDGVDNSRDLSLIKAAQGRKIVAPH